MEPALDSNTIQKRKNSSSKFINKMDELEEELEHIEDESQDEFIIFREKNEPLEVILIEEPIPPTPEKLIDADPLNVNTSTPINTIAEITSAIDTEILQSVSSPKLNETTNLDISPISPPSTSSLSSSTPSSPQPTPQSTPKLLHQNSFVHRRYKESLSQESSMEEPKTQQRPKSDSLVTVSNTGPSTPFRRDSVIRQSFNSIFRRSKIKRKDKDKEEKDEKDEKEEKDEKDKNDDSKDEKVMKDENIENCDEINRSNDTKNIIVNINNNSSGTSTSSSTSSSSNNENKRDISASDISNSEIVARVDKLITGIVKKSHSRNNSTSSSGSYRSTSSVGLSIRSAPAAPMSPLQGHGESHLTTNQGQSAVSLNTISRSPSHVSTKSDTNSIHHNRGSFDSLIFITNAGGSNKRSQKQLSTSPPNRSPSPVPGKSKSDISEKDEKKEKEPKEKKRKELSSSRQKKFHRHFQQVDNDEKVINYFSCALVSDILLQGHLYITQNYLAFYSNVFGYVTKLLIPTVSVVKISKEKTGKIFPNAVGVTTAEERHVFGSFMSREAAYRLMLSVCNSSTDEIEPKVELIVAKIPDMEISSIEDDSSCSMSGNESPPPINDTSSNENSPSGAPATAIDSGHHGNITKHKDEVTFRKITMRDTNKLQSSNLVAPPNVSPSPNKLKMLRNLKFKYPTDVHIVYLGVIFAFILSLFSGFLLYKIQDIQARTNGFSSLDFKLGSSSDIDVYAEVLRWQKEMQAKSAEEAQIILSSNLEQIARVRKSLETLSILIHDKNSPLVSPPNPPLNSFHTTEDTET